MADYIFWGAILSASQRTVTWEDDHDRECLGKSQYLTVKQIFLGEGVKEFEEQVVQVEVTSKFGKNVQPIAFLRQSTLEHVSVNVNFSDHPVTFSLVKGLGPVHLIGNHTYECPGDLPDESDVDEWVEEAEKSEATEGDEMEVEREAGKKYEEKTDTAERDDAASSLERKKRRIGETSSQDLMERHTKEAQSRSAEETLQRWVEARHLVRDFERALRKAQERLRVLERDNPWLGSIKGILRKKDGKAFNIPEGPKVARVAPQEEKSASSSKKKQANPRREKAAMETRKRPAAPLIEKSHREADAKTKNLQTPPGSSFNYSEEVLQLADLLEVPLPVLLKELASRKQGNLPGPRVPQ